WPSGEEVAAAIPVLDLLDINKAKVGLVDQRRRIALLDGGQDAGDVRGVGHAAHDNRARPALPAPRMVRRGDLLPRFSALALGASVLSTCARKPISSARSGPTRRRTCRVSVRLRAR